MNKAIVTRSITSIFCDDIREEIGGKRTYVGIYRSIAYLDEFPFLFPKFCVILTAHSPPGEVVKEASIRLLLDDEVLVEAPIQMKSETVLQDSNGIQQLLAEGRISPFRVEKECVLRARFILDGVEYGTPALRFALAPVADIDPADAPSQVD